MFVSSLYLPFFDRSCVDCEVDAREFGRTPRRADGTPESCYDPLTPWVCVDALCGYSVDSLRPRWAAPSYKTDAITVPGIELLLLLKVGRARRDALGFFISGG